MSCDRQVKTCSPDRTVEIAEHQPFHFGTVEGVGVDHAVRRDLELMRLERPGDAPAERELEARQRLHHERVGVLRVEPEVAQDARIAVAPRLRLLGRSTPADRASRGRTGRVAS